MGEHRILMLAAVAVAALGFITIPKPAVSAPAAKAASVLPGALVTPQWLHEHLNNVVAIDVRTNMKSLTAAPKMCVDEKTGARTVTEIGGHIPGALSVEAATWGQMRIALGHAGADQAAMVGARMAWQAFLNRDR